GTRSSPCSSSAIASISETNSGLPPAAAASRSRSSAGRQTPPLHRWAVDPGQRLRDEVRLSDPCLPDDGQERATAVNTHPLPGPFDRGELALGSDELRLVTALARRPRREQPESDHRLSLSPQLECVDWFDLDRFSGEPQHRRQGLGSLRGRATE